MPTPRKNNIKKIKTTNFILPFIIILLSLFALALFLRSNYFNINSIVISYGENALSKEYINNQLYKLRGENIIFYNEEDITNTIYEENTEIKNIIIQKVFPNKLEIKIINHPKLANLEIVSDTLKKIFVVNDKGVAITENKYDNALPKVRLILDTNLQKIEDYKLKDNIIDKELLTYAIESKKIFEDRFNMKSKHINIYNIFKEVHIYTERNFYIWLDTNLSHEEQFHKLKRSLSKLDIKKENLVYIDLRISTATGDKVIFKKRR